jgi:chemotaxis protein MotB
MKKFEEEPAEDDSSGWLVSYADMMTLIACFFILMVAFANFDDAGFNKKAEELSKSFNKGKWKSSDIQLSQLNEEIARHPTLKKMLKISLNTSELVITFSGSVLFPEGKTNLPKELKDSLDTLVDIIRTKNANYQVIIEGHSDPFEHRKNKRVTSAWELAAIRASKVLERFEYLGFSAKNLVAISKGESKPVAENIDDKGEPIMRNVLQNRRVVIKVAKPLTKGKKKIKLGLGVYIDE